MLGRSEALTPKGSATAGTSSAQLCAESLGRLEIEVFNNHTTATVNLSLSATVAAEANKGVFIAPQRSWKSNTYKGAVQVIASGAATPVSYVEV